MKKRNAGRKTVAKKAAVKVTPKAQKAPSVEDKLDALISLMMAGGAPTHQAPPPEQRSSARLNSRQMGAPQPSPSPVDLAKAEQALFPGLTDFGETADFSLDGGFSGDGSREDNLTSNSPFDMPVTKEDWLSFKGHQDAKFEVLANRLKVLTDIVTEVRSYIPNSARGV